MFRHIRNNMVAPFSRRQSTGLHTLWSVLSTLAAFALTASTTIGLSSMALPIP